MKSGLAGAVLALAASNWLPSTARAIGPADAPEIDAAASRAGIVVDLRIGGRVEGDFETLEGRIERLDDGRLQVWVRLDARSLVLNGPAWMGRSMRSSKFLDVEAHQWIQFRSEPFDPDLVREGGVMAGSLTLREQVRPVRFQVQASGCETPGYACDIPVSGEVSRREFGMEAYRVWLHDRVGFDFHVRLRQP